MEAAAIATKPTQETHIQVISLADSVFLDASGYSREYTVEQLLKMANLPPMVDEQKQPKDMSKLPILTCSVEFCPGVSVRAWAVGPYVFIGGQKVHHQGISVHTWNRTVEEVAPFIKVEAIGQAYHQTIEREVRDNGYSYGRSQRMKVIDTYGDGWDHDARKNVPGKPWNYVRVAVTVHAAALVNGSPYPYVKQEGLIKCPQPEGGVIDIDAYGPASRIFRATHEFYGLKLAWDESIEMPVNHSYDNRWQKTHRLLQDAFTVTQGRDALWQRFLDTYEDRSRLSKGVKSTLTKKGIAENITRLRAEEPLLWAYLAWLHDEKARKGISNNTLLAAFLEAKGRDFDTLRSAIRESMAFALTTTPSVHYANHGTPETRVICLGLPGAKDKDEEKRAKKEWYLRKSNKEQAEGLGVSPIAHPKLLGAIEAGKIPFGIFHKTGDQLHLINVEFDLWEKAFEREGWMEPLCQIAQDASRRSKYEKNVTPYIAFLFRIEQYLDKHTGKGKKWKAFPRFVKSEWELEMDEPTEEGTVKKRSALTPIPDNDARTITVPYVAMSIGGVRTLYCYSLDYQVFEAMTIDRESGTPIVNELERRLNGRDDYGFMYYTLTGSPQASGYPAFLIIFERRKVGTHVHFHRVHPCRSKNGKPTPASRIIEECYRYMAGNVRAEEIYAQQGDLIFLKTEQTVEITADAKSVKDFESHAFKPMEDKPILLIPNTSKSIKNRLGFIYSEGLFTVDHPEHEPIKGIPAGMYEVRRAKSWEANPKAVWSYTID